MNNVRMPIETNREGTKITKVCVEDVYKMINRVQDAMNKAYNNSVDIIDSIHKDYKCADGTVASGELIIGTGISQPCLTDAFDEEIGNNIAFMKAKLNANIKKHNFLCRIYNEFGDLCYKMDEEFDKIDKNIIRDLVGLRNFNPEYLTGIEDKLGLPAYEVQE